MQPLVKHLSMLVADAILAGSALDEARKAPVFPAVQPPLKKMFRHRHPRRANSRITCRKVAPLPPAR
jgi:hypothetical protein